jgi:hypothetical protein
MRDERGATEQRLRSEQAQQLIDLLQSFGYRRVRGLVRMGGAR